MGCDTPIDYYSQVVPLTEGRSYCIVPDCDEQPRPGDEVCDTHQREEGRGPLPMTEASRRRA